MHSNTTTHPQFAVVGHPNKGKSSIVSALALDDSVEISDTPGTTTKKRSFPLKVDGKILYELIDTPGFQRSRAVLAWLEQHDVSADKKHEVVLAFINEHREDARFNDEIELLEPIMKGAGIIYVVDGSKPYGKEYEAEMEVLRWTGQPSMALINHIEEVPTLIVSDFNLLDGSTGVEAVTEIRDYYDANIPAFIVTGDTSKVVKNAHPVENSTLMNKPVNTARLPAAARIATRTGEVPAD